IPRGEYRIGINDAVASGFREIEGPEVTVTLGPFYIDRHEVSNEQYNRVAEFRGLAPPKAITNPQMLEPARPVTGITYFDAELYARALGKNLPTAAQWEA